MLSATHPTARVGILPTVRRGDAEACRPPEVESGPSSTLGEPYYQRGLDAQMRAGRVALSTALAVAARAGVSATGEQLDGNPARRVVEFARMRRAQLVVLGSRRRRLGRSVSLEVIRGADRPVLVTALSVQLIARIGLPAFTIAAAAITGGT